MKSFIRRLIPESVIQHYHTFKARTAALWYGYPTKRLIVIGITGTKGKTSTANYVWSVLHAGHFRVGLIGTANIRIDTDERMNEHHMTMPGPWILQKLFREMLDAGCTHVVMEATSEGMKYNRHLGIIFDYAIFTNLTPEHLPSHGGSFERYKSEKTKLFQALTHPRKVIDGRTVKTVNIVNADSDHAPVFASFEADMHQSFGLVVGDVHAQNVAEHTHGVKFSYQDALFELSIPGLFNVYNALPAIIVGHCEQIPTALIQQGLRDLSLIPGRMERIDAGQPFTLIVDYAHEKVSMNGVLDTARAMSPDGKIIVLLGAEGGGRDKAKREHMGIAAGKKADYVILSNVDPYEDDPQEIVDDIAQHVRKEGKVDGENLFCILDRRDGIRKALSLAHDGDVVLLTGKGAEQSMIIGGKAIPWDDRTITQELLQELGYTVKQ